jgi:DNA mismatch repair protein MSH2
LPIHNNATEYDKKGFITYFRSLPEDAKVLRIFNRKDFYSVHGDDATFVARTFYKTTTVVGGGAVQL